MQDELNIFTVEEGAIDTLLKLCEGAEQHYLVWRREGRREGGSEVANMEGVRVGRKEERSEVAKKVR